MIIAIIFVPYKTVFLEDSIATNGLWKTHDEFGGTHYTSKKISNYSLWKYKGYYKQLTDK